jgi:phosphatidylinositol kinase/protein kinase (PI-3  family)
MEFNGVVNRLAHNYVSQALLHLHRLLQQDPDGRSRKLRLKTFAVVCLNEHSGIIEWVSNTSGK